MAKNISVALSGSGFLFPVHLGALHALDDYGYTVDELIGTSGGSLVAAMVSGKKYTWPQLQELVLETDFSFAMSKDLLTPWRFFHKGGLCSTRPMVKWIGKHAGQEWPKMKVGFITTDSRTWESVVLRSGSTSMTFAQCAVASACLPAIYPPMNGIYQDGGILENLGEKYLTGKTKVGIRLVEPQKSVTNFGILDNLTGAVSAMLDKIETLEVHNCPDVLTIPVDVSNYSFLDTDLSLSAKEKLWNLGYNAVQGSLHLIK